jgi:hypothetical protein
VSAYFFFKHWSTGLLLVSLLFFVAFLLLVWYALKLKERKALLEKLLFINSNELGILSNEPNRLDNGSAFANGKGYAEDLDIFGPRSLFHLLIRCTTAHGREYLATLLREPLTDPARITARQQAVQFMSNQPGKRQLITAHGLLHAEAEGNLHSIAEWLQPEAGLHKKKMAAGSTVGIAFIYYSLFFVLYRHRQYIVCSGRCSGYMAHNSLLFKIYTPPAPAHQ